MTGENYLRAAYSYLYIRDFKKAESTFKLAILSDPENPDYYFHASITALRNGAYLRALRWVKTALKLAPGDSLYLVHQGTVRSCILVREAKARMAEGDNDRARQLLTRALEHDPLNDDAQVSLTSLSRAEPES